MKATCFACAEQVEGNDADAVARAFVAHGMEKHSWSYPESAVRQYAINCAEAGERLSGSTERLPVCGAISIHPVTEDRVDDWLHFFDHDGFAGNPSWASCYCLEPHVPATKEQPERPWRESRAAVSARLRNRATFGYLAYVDGRAAGWVNASLRSDYGQFHDVDPDGPNARSVIGIGCFLVAPPYRRHGMASLLLDRVIADAASRGAQWVEGYPHNTPEESDAGHFRGTRGMYEARGFHQVETRERYTVMRRQVAPVGSEDLPQRQV